MFALYLNVTYCSSDNNKGIPPIWLISLLAVDLHTYCSSDNNNGIPPIWVISLLMVDLHTYCSSDNNKGNPPIWVISLLAIWSSHNWAKHQTTCHKRLTLSLCNWLKKQQEKYTIFWCYTIYHHFILFNTFFLFFFYRGGGGNKSDRKCTISQYFKSLTLPHFLL